MLHAQKHFEDCLKQYQVETYTIVTHQYVPFFSNGSDAFYLAEDGEHNLEGLNCELI